MECHVNESLPKSDDADIVSSICHCFEEHVEKHGWLYVLPKSIVGSTNFEYYSQ